MSIFNNASITPLFEGRFFSYLSSVSPLSNAKVFAKGSTAMLFEDGDKLFRLTLDGVGHNYLAMESDCGNPYVVKVVHDYGPVAPSDEHEEEYYWLSSVERLEELKDSEPDVLRLKKMFELLNDGETLVLYDAIFEFIGRVDEAMKSNTEFFGILRTLSNAAYFAKRYEADVDIDISNLMRRPGTREIVWIDPLFGCLYPLKSEQLEGMNEIRKS